MGKKERLELISKLQTLRKSAVISYITSTRNALEVQMAIDCIRKMYSHLEPLASQKPNIDLFLHSNGGDGTVPWRIVTLIREFTRKFSVLIPHRAFSAATLTALGADTIIMHPMGMLGPTDPTVANPFNPMDKSGKQIGISVEDVSAYISLIREDVGIRHEDELVQAFNILAEKIHPLALGNVKRSLSQSKVMAQKLLALHLNPKTEEHSITEIVDNLTSKAYFHGHPINRKEAKEQIGISFIENPNSDVEKTMWALYKEYEAEMMMEEPFNFVLEWVAAFPDAKPDEQHITEPRECSLAFIESSNLTDRFSMRYQVAGSKDKTGMATATFIKLEQGWKKD